MKTANRPSVEAVVRFLGSVGALGSGFITWAFYYENGIKAAAWTWAILACCALYVCMKKPNAPAEARRSLQPDVGQLKGGAA
jgi:hypothetical protein